MTDAERVAADHELVADLVVAGFLGVGERDVEVHVKARADRVVRWLLRCRPDTACGRPSTTAPAKTGGIARAPASRRCASPATRTPTSRPSGWSSARPTRSPAAPTRRLPDLARVSHGIRYLATLTIPADPAATGDPCPRLVAAATRPPAIIVAEWCEELVHLAAHEPRHTHQFRRGLPRSEIDAERWALARLHRLAHRPGPDGAGDRAARANPEDSSSRQAPR